MVDGRYAIIYADSKNSNVTLENPFLSQGGIYAMFIEYGKVVKRDPAILYQTSITGLSFDDIDCSIAYVGVGQTCIVTGKFTNQKYFYLKVDFLSSGIVYKVEPLNVQLHQGIDQYNVETLRYGGYFHSGQGENKDDPRTTLMYGYVINGSVIYSWDLPNPIVANFDAVWTILNNNNFVYAPPEGTQ